MPHHTTLYYNFIYELWYYALITTIRAFGKIKEDANTKGIEHWSSVLNAQTLTTWATNSIVTIICIALLIRISRGPIKKKIEVYWVTGIGWATLPWIAWEHLSQFRCATWRRLNGKKWNTSVVSDIWTSSDLPFTEI